MDFVPQCTNVIRNDGLSKVLANDHTHRHWVNREFKASEVKAHTIAMIIKRDVKIQDPLMVFLHRWIRGFEIDRLLILEGYFFSRNKKI